VGDSALVTLRPMSETDLGRVGTWLARPHVAHWWYEDASRPAVRARYLPAIRGDEATHLVIAERDGAAIGFAQWYGWDDEPHAAAYGARPGELGIDYLIGEAGACGQGAGTALVAALVARVRAQCPEASILTSPEQSNVASCRVLEKNGFRLVGVRRIECEPGGGPHSLYRLDPAARGQLSPG
jgi:aminoglycoside 6'-N-acetyltransferase